MVLEQARGSHRHGSASRDGDGVRTRAEKCGRPLNGAKGKKTDFALEPPEGAQLCQHRVHPTLNSKIINWCYLNR